MSFAKSRSSELLSAMAPNASMPGTKQDCAHRQLGFGRVGCAHQMLHLRVQYVAIEFAKDRVIPDLSG